MSINLKTNLTGILLAGGKSKRPGFNKIEIRIDDIPLFIDVIFKLSLFCNEILISSSENNYDFISYEINKIRDYHDHYYQFCGFTKIPLLRIILDKDKDRPERYDIDKNCTGIGPINGLESGLEYAGNFYSLVTAFDMPFISYNLLHLLEEIKNNQNKPQDAFIIKTEKGFEALCGIYSKNCLNVIKENILKKIYRISEIFPYIDTLFIAAVKENTYKKNIKSDAVNIDFYQLNKKRIDSLNFFNINTAYDYNYFNKIWDLQIFSNQAISSLTGDAVNLFCEKWKYFFYR